MCLLLIGVIHTRHRPILDLLPSLLGGAESRWSSPAVVPRVNRSCAPPRPAHAETYGVVASTQPITNAFSLLPSRSQNRQRRTYRTIAIVQRARH
jgi:hypothetical protein